MTVTTLPQALANKASLYGNKLDNIGKDEGFFEGRTFLVFDSKTGWDVVRFNAVERFFRWAFGAFKNSHFDTIDAQLIKELGDQAAQVRISIEKRWVDAKLKDRSISPQIREKCEQLQRVHAQFAASLPAKQPSPVPPTVPQPAVASPSTTQPPVPPVVASVPATQPVEPPVVASTSATEPSVPPAEASTSATQPPAPPVIANAPAKQPVAEPAPVPAEEPPVGVAQPVAGLFSLVDPALMKNLTGGTVPLPPPARTPAPYQAAASLPQSEAEQARDHLQALEKQLPETNRSSAYRLHLVRRELEKPEGKALAQIVLAHLDKPADQLFQIPEVAKIIRTGEEEIIPRRLQTLKTQDPKVQLRIARIVSSDLTKLPATELQKLLDLRFEASRPTDWIWQLNEMGDVLGLQSAFKQIDAGAKLDQSAKYFGGETGVRLTVLSANRDKLTDEQCDKILGQMPEPVNVAFLNPICEELQLTSVVAIEDAKQKLRSFQSMPKVSRPQLAKIAELLKVKNMEASHAERIKKLSVNDPEAMTQALDALGKELNLEDAFAVIDIERAKQRLEHLFKEKNARLSGRMHSISSAMAGFQRKWQYPEEGVTTDFTPLKEAQKQIFALSEGLSDAEYLTQLDAIGIILGTKFIAVDRDAAYAYVNGLSAQPGLDPVLKEKLGDIAYNIRGGHAENSLKDQFAEKIFALQADEGQVDAIGKEIGLERNFALKRVRSTITTHLGQLHSVVVDPTKRKVRAQIDAIRNHVADRRNLISEEQQTQILELKADSIEELEQKLVPLIQALKLERVVTHTLAGPERLF